MLRLVDFITRHHRRLTLALLLGTLLPAGLLPRLEINNSIEVWLPRDSAEYARYQAFTSRFGSDEFVVLAMESPDALAPASLALQARLADTLGRIEGVDEVLALPQFASLIAPDAQGKPRLQDGGFLHGLLLGRDGKTAGMLVWLRELTDPRARRVTVEAIEQAADQIAGPGRIHLAGTPQMNVALDQASRRASMIFLPLALAASILILLAMLRGAWATASVIIAVAAGVIWTMGLMALAGRSLNMVTVILPSLLFTLALSNGIHLAAAFSRNLTGPGRATAALRATLTELIRPTFLTAITTAIGFGSLMISGMTPVSDLGLFAALGIMTGFVCTLILVPSLMALAPARFARPMPRPRAHWTERGGRWAARHPWPMMALALGLAILFGLEMRQIRTESNVLKFFPASSRVARDYDFIGRRLTGFSTVELDICCPVAKQPDALAAMEQLARAIERQPGVARVDDLGRVEKFGRDATRGGLQITPGSALRFLKLRARFVHEEGGALHLRMSVLVNAMDSTRFDALMRTLGEDAQTILPTGMTFETTGIVPLLNEAQQTLVRTQVNTFLLAGVAILAVIGLLFRSWRVLLAAIPANLVPILGAFALMAWRGIPLDAATVMIASIAIGISVDNTIHFLTRYREALGSGSDGPQAAEAAFARMGRAAVFTSLVAAAGFGVLALASFRPIAEFGLIESCTMLAALAGDLFILPASARLLNLKKG